MSEVMLESTARAQFNTWLMSIFGGCALLLSSVGIYGLLAYSVQQRTREIGVRMALGAARGDVRRMVLRDGLFVTTVGIVVGLAASLGLSRFLSTLLFHVSPYDRLVFASVAVLLFASALVGVAIPCHRATLISPADAIRAE
jgi:ABC-type antimicrobial peptide transport system permease subunit